MAPAHRVFLSVALPLLATLACKARGPDQQGSRVRDAAVAAAPAGTDCSSQWELFSSKPFAQIALPDTNVTYWRYRFEVPAQGKVGLVIKGQFPFARYMNYNVYDQNTIDTSASLPDRAIVPDPGAVNPFLTGHDRGAATRGYTAWLVPPGQGGRVGSGANVMEMPMPTSGNNVVELWYRVYVPDLLDGRPMDNGGVPLPTLGALDLETMTAAPCPAAHTQTPPLGGAAKNLPPAASDGTIAFYASIGAHALYANGDNHYASGRLSIGFGAEVAVVRLKAPSFPNTQDGTDVDFSAADVRYWSICLGDATTRTAACAADHETRQDDAGYVTLVIGPDDMAAAVRGAGLNFLARGNHFLFLPFLVYRNLLASPTYPGRLDADSVLGWPPPAGHTVDPAALTLPHFTHEYAPVGRTCAARDFQAGLAAKAAELCGVQVSYVPNDAGRGAAGGQHPAADPGQPSP